MSVLKKSRIPFEEYVKIEEEGVKYEYHQGEIFVVAHESNNHARICRNISTIFGNILRKKKGNCELFSSVSKLYIPSEDRAFYPDGMFICQADIEAGEEYFLTRPTFIIEILSNSTEAYDRGDKFSYYRKILTLKEYILISQKTAKVEISKKVSDLWLTRHSSGLDKELKIESLDVEISLSEIYRGVEFLPRE